MLTGFELYPRWVPLKKFLVFYKYITAMHIRTKLKRAPQKLSFCFNCPDTSTVRILGNILYVLWKN